MEPESLRPAAPSEHQSKGRNSFIVDYHLLDSQNNLPYSLLIYIKEETIEIIIT